ncbi:putative formate transporter 1 [bioreactor metagenome]|jgi:formate/nitrite transporter|uniref:Putative formate transporter 1 n=1 Tax=bioreactor metagenome TaxID=1076179 RepID=A0A644V0E8_9ZZZZ|nr:formate/nitrite transporter family protein [Bacteroidales bacterium]MBP8677200.1 formate/nitrite transporter family protein [Bacteroidales bacterium]MBP9584731.1 formate/nitrite transporter family protein [Bacteroidales bacterium]MBP9978063.1 formate/nitrite transporter family protein [Bacteroidales bacterium]
MSNNYLTPSEIVDYTEETGIKKAGMPVLRTLLLAFLAGVFIALASVGSNIISHDIENIGVAKYLAGLIFPTGLILVVIAGAELFTGNNLISIAALSGKVKWSKYFWNLIMVWLGNLVGSVFIALLIYLSGQLNYTDGLLGAYTIKVAALKTSLSFTEAFASGILCNLLVCLAVWMSYSTKDIAGKALVIFFPIWLFIASGYEHSVANMYYLTAGLLAKNNPDLVLKTGELMSFSAENLNNLTILNAFMDNLVPVTIGNLVGGALFIGALYWWAYKKVSR